jgi:2-oxoglutarate dehydrogenase E2 component (dihydrolipoamide succinyltransferase)
MDVVMPQLGETVSEGTVLVWCKKVGDVVKADETLFEVSTDKVDTEIPAPADGVLAEILVQEGETVNVGAKLAVIDDGGASAATKADTEADTGSDAQPGAAEAKPSPPPASPDMSGNMSRNMAGVLSPVVSRLLAEHGLDAADIAGTGRGGRITRRDVMARIEAGGAGTGTAPGTAPVAPEALPDGATLVPFSRINRLTGEHMVRSKATSPHVLQAVEADFGAVNEVRAAHRESWTAAEGFALSYLPFIARATCLAIADFPNVNARIAGEGLAVFSHVHLGIAVDIELAELVVPVIRDAEAKSVAELARAIDDMAGRARERTLKPDDLSGGTYTISNSGAFGTLITAPIINQPQVAILSTDGIRKRPVVVEDEGGDSITIRPIGILAQSFDHRAMGGAYSAAFLGRLRQIIETRDWAAEIG